MYNADLHDTFTRKYNVEKAILGGGIGELEALAKNGEKEHHFSPGWSSLLVEMLNTFQIDESSKVTAAYWTVSNATIQGLLVRVRTALADLVAELVTLTPEDQVVPDKGAVDAAVQFVITGDRNTINYSPQHAASGGTNTVVGALAGPVTVSGAQGTAIGSQTAGDNSSVVGSQAVHGNHNTVPTRTRPPARWATRILSTRTGGPGCASAAYSSRSSPSSVGSLASWVR